MCIVLCIFCSPTVPTLFFFENRNVNQGSKVKEPNFSGKFSFSRFGPNSEITTVEFFTIIHMYLKDDQFLCMLQFLVQ